MAEKTIRVEFIDAATGQMFGFADSPPEQLPDTFALMTSINLGGQEYQVEKADPVTRAEYMAQGKLTLTLSKISMMPVKDILYSLPTFFDPIPAPDAKASPEGKNIYTIHADLWRSMEFVMQSERSAIQIELGEIAKIFEHHSEGEGFNKLHIRKSPAAPVAGLFTLGALRQHFSGAIPFDAVAYQREPGLIRNAYALRYGKWVLYGDVRDDKIQSLAIEPVPDGANLPLTPFITLMQQHNLYLVDWCNVRTLTAAEAEPYLQQFNQKLH
jgi:hypothetical protein